MKLKILLVTSQVTYMPDNYLPLFRELLKEHAEDIAGLALLQNVDKKTLKSALGLPLIGARRIGAQLWRNIFELPLKRRERLFAAYNLPIYEWATMNDEVVTRWLHDNQIDLVVNLRTRCLYKSPVLKLPKFGCINIHHGLLPEYRGTLCDLYALADDRPAGFSIHVMEKKVDNGAILKRVEVSQGDKNYLDYLRKTAVMEAHALGEILTELKKNQKLPEGKPNISEKIVYTQNPTRTQIKDFLKRGFQL